jgi:hypothetical protein
MPLIPAIRAESFDGKVVPHNVRQAHVERLSSMKLYHGPQVFVPILKNKALAKKIGDSTGH